MKKTKNYEASIKDKLRMIARTEGKSHQLLLIRYFQERLLFRLSKSEYKSIFYLKGAAFLYALFQEKSRMTKDIDLLGKHTPATIKNLTKIFSEIAKIDCLEDGVSFDASSITATEIVKDGKYQGIRISLKGFIDRTNQKLQIDIGFGDIITPHPIEMEYPTILNLPAPLLFSYNVETVIAEKFEAMIALSEINTRMKDFYDVYHLLKFGKYDKQLLKKAIFNTFEQRKTKTTNQHPIFITSFFNDENRLKLWFAWLNKMSLNTNLKFKEVMSVINNFLYPIYKELVTSNQNS